MSILLSIGQVNMGVLSQNWKSTSLLGACRGCVDADGHSLGLCYGAPVTFKSFCTMFAWVYIFNAAVHSGGACIFSPWCLSDLLVVVFRSRDGHDDITNCI